MPFTVKLRNPVLSGPHIAFETDEFVPWIVEGEADKVDGWIIIWSLRITPAPGQPPNYEYPRDGLTNEVLSPVIIDHIRTQLEDQLHWYKGVAK